MKLSTDVAFEPLNQPLAYHHGLVFAGSCFAENIGEWLRHCGFRAAVNTTGIAYNPISISRHIHAALEGVALDSSAFVAAPYGAAHLDFHSTLTAENQTALDALLQKSLSSYARQLAEADYLFVTLGTAIAFVHSETGTVANNCHKLHSSCFDMRFLEIEEMESAMHQALLQLISINEKLRIVLTISPVRHLRHGAVDNLRSKARLVLLCEKLTSLMPQCTYLPIYELVMDQLRDYRFYRHDDLIHLNEAGLGMVKEHFAKACIASESLQMMDRVQRWRAMQQHRLMHPASEDAIKFAERLKQETLEISALLPHLAPGI